MSELFQILGSAGDVATVAIAIGFYRMDKRISFLEWWRDSHHHGHPDDREL